MSDTLSQAELEDLVGESLEDMGLEEAFEHDAHVREFPGDASDIGRPMPWPPHHP
jgi:hypothetical protein